MLWWDLYYFRLTFQLSDYHRVPLTAPLSYTKISALYRKTKILNSIKVKLKNKLKSPLQVYISLFNHIYQGQPQWLFHIIGFPVYPSQEHPEQCPVIETQGMSLFINLYRYAAQTNIWLLRSSCGDLRQWRGLTVLSETNLPTAELLGLRRHSFNEWPNRLYKYKQTSNWYFPSRKRPGVVDVQVFSIWDTSMSFKAFDLSLCMGLL